MKKINPNARYFETNEWAVKEGQYFIIGITDFAQTVFGSIIFLELPPIGAIFQQGQSFATIESNKATNDLTMPLSGEIIAINQAVINHPQLLNQDPYEVGWLVKIKAISSSEWEQLMSEMDYQNYIGAFFNKS